MIYKSFIPLILTVLVTLSCDQGQSDRIDALEEQQKELLKTAHKVLTGKVDHLLWYEEGNWVLFENGTFVLVDSSYSEATTRRIALDLIREYGPYDENDDSSTFYNVTPAKDQNAWVVGCQHPQIFTFVQPIEIGSSNPPRETIGKQGIWKRDQDSQHKKVIHVFMR